MGWIDRTPAEYMELLRIQALPRTGLHVTDCLGCPRRRALLAEGVPVDLPKLDSRLSGSILHSAMARINQETAEVPVSGILFGHKIEGSIDRVEASDDEAHLFTCDYKTSENGTPAPTAPYPEQVWQQEAYRFLLAQDDKLTSGWRIYYRKMGKWTCYEHRGQVWTEEKLSSFRPHSGAFTTAELAGQCVSGLQASGLSLVGATMKMGRGTPCDFCEVAGPCGEAGYVVEL